MKKLFDSEFLKKLENLVLNSRIVLNEGSSGNRKSRSKGASVEFSDYREYSPGDDFRRVDWSAYGRFEKLYLKLFMEEREAPVNIFLDVSKSMDWGVPNKSVASRRLAAALAYISLAGFDRVSLSCINSKVESVKQSLRGKASFPEAVSFLENVEYAGTTDLYNAVRQSQMKQDRGITILISDFLAPLPLDGLISLLQYRRQEIYICHVLSPQEETPEIGTNLRLIDSETGMYRDVTATALLLQTYARVYSKFISGLEETCFKRGVRYSRLLSSMPFDRMIRTVLT